jgi:hypothetical protein
MIQPNAFPSRPNLGFRRPNGFEPLPHADHNVLALRDAGKVQPYSVSCPAAIRAKEPGIKGSKS